jgi:hypothetical protein
MGALDEAAQLVARDPETRPAIGAALQRILAGLRVG